jgi:general nucleoside transport system ATP-binding protein
MIELIDITKNFGQTLALDRVTLRITSGTIHGIVGENGAGKSTLMKVLTGFLSKTSGRILFQKQTVTLDGPRAARRLGIGMLYQEPMDFPQLSALENFMAGGCHAPSRQRRRFLELAGRFGFDLSPDQRAENMTIGQRQQLELLRLIQEEVRVLILDEPTTGISPEQEAQLFDALRTLRAQGAAILLVSHKLAEVEALCDRVSVLRHGRVMADQEAPFSRDTLLNAMFDQLPDRTDRPAQVAPGAPVLTCKDLFCSAGRSGLHIADLSIGGGEIVGLAGLDGSGQTVLLQLARGLMRPERGSIHCFGAPCRSTALDPVYLPADRLTEGLVSGLSLREHHLLTGRGLSLLHRQSGRQQAQTAIKTFSIRGQADTPVETLSGGNQQRLLLSLIPPDTRLILLEHPTRGLDVHSAAWTWQHLQARVRPDGALLFASPDLEEIMDQATRILVFFEGRIILDAPSAQLTPTMVSQALTGTVPGPGTHP